MHSSLNIPPASSGALSAGARLTPEHAAAILGDTHAAGFFEVRAGDYMGAGGPPLRLLRQIRDRYPISIHGLGLSLGEEHPLDREHLARLRDLIGRYQPSLISEHLAWSALDGTFFNALLPLPYNEETLNRVCRNVDDAQQSLGMQLLIANPPAYLTFSISTISEADFLRAVAVRTGCGLLLDVAHVCVSAGNLEFEPMGYIDAFPIEYVREIRLAGFFEETDGDGTRLLIGDHSRAVPPIVWSIYRRIISRIGPVPTAIERAAVSRLFPRSRPTSVWPHRPCNPRRPGARDGASLTREENDHVGAISNSNWRCQRPVRRGRARSRRHSR